MVWVSAVPHQEDTGGTPGALDTSGASREHDALFRRRAARDNDRLAHRPTVTLTFLIG